MDGMTKEQLELLLLLARKAAGDPILVASIQLQAYKVIKEASSPDKG